MRVVVQRVSQASVIVNEEMISRIDRGLLVLLAVHHDDSPSDISYMVDKVINLRVFEDSHGKMNLSVLDNKYSILAISQFTLYGDTRKGRRPSFIQAAKHKKAEEYYDLFCKELEQSGLVVQKGIFAADMKVGLVNDGPVTIQIDSSKLY